MASRRVTRSQKKPEDSSEPLPELPSRRRVARVAKPESPYTPDPIYRWAGERENPASDLGWDIEKNNDYHFPRFAEGVVMYAPGVGTLPLPGPLVEVLQTFVQNIPRDMWEKWNIDWNKDTPALQFHNKRALISESLPVENMFRCQLDSDYFMGLCESGTKKSAEGALRDHPLDWWKERFGEFTLQNVALVEPRIEKVSSHLSRKNMVIVRYIDRNGVKTNRVVPKGEENNIPSDLVGERNVEVVVLPDEKIVDDKDPFTLARTVSVGKCRKDAIEYLAQHYKIRMQIPPEHQVWLVNQLMEYFSTDEVGACVEVFKCSLVYSKIISANADTRLASIVIYVKPGKELARRVLNGLVERFANIEHLGLGIPSRYNLTTNRLIYYSGADGDLKTALARENLIDKYFDRSTNPPYAYFTGYEL
jgi:hypothetical protein